MKKKTGTVLMIVGTVLISAALFLFVYNQWDAKRAEKEALQVVEQLKKLEEGKDSDHKEYEEDTEMKVVTIDGHDYIGYLSIPAIEQELPVMAEWSYPGLKIAPGRFYGSTYTKDLVIAGHNYAKHFSPIKWLAVGTEVDFTDMNNRVWKYKVVSIETLQPTQVEQMITKSDTDEWDLTMFTCNTGGRTRCTVRCVEQ